MFKTLLAAAALAIAATPALAQTAPAAPCQEPERGQFDFWVGNWDVYATGQEVLVARSTIEKLYGGCAVRENWKPLKGTGGGSLNAWRPDEKGWRQTWLDSNGAWAEFRGGWNGTAIVIQGDWSGTLTRMTYTPLADGSVRQFGETSADKGATWKPGFDLTYRRAR
jgi:hypothetical protein